MPRSNKSIWSVTRPDIAHYRAAGGQAPALAVAPYPFQGTHSNTGRRLQQVADLANIDIIGFPRPGTDGWPPNWELKRSLAQQNFSTYSHQAAELLGPLAARYDKVLAWGDSTASYAIGPLILNKALPFTHSLIRDGINYNAPQLPVIGEWNYLLYQLTSERNKPPDDSPPDVGAATERQPSHPAHAAAEILTYSHLWRSLYSQHMVQSIAFERPDLPVSLVSVGHTFTGSPDQAEQFGQRMAAARHREYAEYAAIETTMEADWYHSDLLDPGKAVSHIAASLALQSFVDRPAA